MAEGWAYKLNSEVFESYSAGIEKHGLNADAVRVMAEAGVDISDQSSKTLDELPVHDFDLVITLCDQASETCPLFSGQARRLHHSFPDPPKLATGARNEGERLAPYRRVRDEIRAFVETIPGKLQQGDVR